MQPCCRVPELHLVSCGGSDRATWDTIRVRSYSPLKKNSLCNRSKHTIPPQCRSHAGSPASRRPLCPPQVRGCAAASPDAFRRHFKLRRLQTLPGFEGKGKVLLCALSPARWYNVIVCSDCGCGDPAQAMAGPGHALQAPAVGGEVFVLQFTTRYVHPDGSTRLRVVTAARRWVSRGDEEVCHPPSPSASPSASVCLRGSYLSAIVGIVHYAPGKPSGAEQACGASPQVHSLASVLMRGRSMSCRALTVCFHNCRRQGWRLQPCRLGPTCRRAALALFDAA